ncbi:uncharacterized protein K452DRAFT_48977 [Aplosporella prunicola CBS 121167]|uniref:Uncharacterized protein n=1 Tax=Aplosporella prunicola CBS 121167 TaxID=1176127 RepID=A0A6A6B8Z2_9PEZI|nr:uncharacterized protein K452DRAFT_48977 [Aplosporella prunicola CBS 121167]KAF2140610.1 hypothetical protein K452DRAFT_48977 [Aplosporella prunicola CBS 121167]
MSVDLGKAYTHRNAIFAAPGHTSLQNRRTYFTHAFAKTNDLVLRDALNLSNSPTVPLENTQSDTLLMGKKLARNRRIHLTQKRLTDSEMKGLMSPEYLPLSHFWAGLKDRVNEIRDIELSYLDYAVWESNYHLVQLTRQAFFIHPTAFPTTNTAEGHAWIQNPDEETIRRETARKEEVFSSQHNDDLALPSFIVIDLITKELDSICQHVEDIGESIYNSLAITETTLTYKRMDDNDDADDKQTQPTQATQTSAPTTLLRYARVDAPPPLLRYAHVDDALSPIVRAKAVKKPLPYKKTKPASPPSVKYKLTGPPKGLLRTVRVGSTKDKTEPDASMTSPNQVLEVKDGRIQITPFAPEPPAPQMRIVWGSEAVRQTQRGALERRKAKMEKASARAQQQKSGGIVRRVKFDALAPGQLEDSPIRPYTSHTETQVPGFEKRMITMASLPLAKRVRKLPTTTPLHLRVLLLRKQLSRSHRVLRKTFNLLGRMDSVRDRWDQIVLWRAQELRRHQDPQGARGRELELQKRSSPLERLAGSMRVSAEEEVEDALGGGVGVGEALPPTTFFLEKPLQRGRGGGGGAGVRVGAEEKEYQAQQPRIRKLVSDTGLTPAQKLLRAEMFDLVRDLDHLLSDLNKEGRDGDEDDEFEDGYGYEDEDEFEFEFEKRDRDGGKGGDGV